MTTKRITISLVVGIALAAAVACGAKDDAATASSGADPVKDKEGSPAPVPGDGPTFSSISSTGFTVAWSAAKDDKTDAAGLEYQLVSAAKAADLEGIEKVEAATGAAIVVPWSKNAFTKAITGVAPSTTRAYAVLVRDAEGYKGLYKAQEVTTSAPGAPAPGAAITFSDVTTTSFKANWGLATDGEDTSLSYKVVRANVASQIDSVDEIEAITGTAASDWLTDATEHEFAGLDIGAHYSVAVLVKDTAGLKAVYSPATRATTPKRIFVTNDRIAATFGTPGSADTECNNDSAKPDGGGTYKALVSGAGRVACTGTPCAMNQQADWVLQPNMGYGRPDGTIVGRSDANALLPQTLLASILPGSDTYGKASWGGFDSSWRTDSSITCSNWSSSDGNANAARIIPTHNAPTWLNYGVYGTGACNTTQPLVCVEQ